MEAADYTAKFTRIIELNELAEQEYIQRLKISNPLITEDEIKTEVRKWWLDKPEYRPEEFFRPASRERL